MIPYWNFLLIHSKKFDEYSEKAINKNAGGNLRLTRGINALQSNV